MLNQSTINQPWVGAMLSAVVEPGRIMLVNSVIRTPADQPHLHCFLTCSYRLVW